jgi:subtilisin family serine protease
MRYFILILLFSTQIFASEFLVYNLPASTSLKLEPVFSITELTMMKNHGLDLNVSKVEYTNEKELRDLLKVNCPKCIIESNSAGSLKSDPYKAYQWALENKGQQFERWTSDIDSYFVQGIKGQDINLNSNETAKTIKVAMIDSGIDINHPDLKDQIHTDEKECAALADYNTCLNTQTDKNICYEKYKDFDANGNGYALDCHGWSITDKSNPLNDIEGNGNINDLNGHGTHIAGIIAAKKNDIGIQGVIQHVELVPIQVSVASKNKSNEVATDKFAKALLYAIQSKVDIVNMSLGWRFDQDSLLMREMIKLAFKNNILIVAAAGNDSHSSATYPCSYEEVICVGSHDVDGKISSFSNFGPHIDLLAPGSNILSTWPTNKRSRSFTLDSNYEYLSGTSQATPYVTGVLARLLNQGLSAKDAKIKLLKGARSKLHTLDDQVRFGNLDYLNALGAKSESFVFPLNKSAALINWDKKIKTFTLKLKNYSTIKVNRLLTIEPILSKTQNSFKLVTSKKQNISLAIGETKEIKIKFTSDNNVEGNFVFKILLDQTEFYFQAKALSLINPENERSDMDLFELQDTNRFLKDALIKEFSNYTEDSTKDYLAIKEVDGKTHIARLSQTNNTFVVSDNFALPFKESVIINLSKVDLDLDGSVDYVITLVNLDDPKNRVTKFLALDSSFKPKRISISPKNTFDNSVTVLPGGFIWLKVNKKMVPAWITLGERPENEREALSPWNDRPVELKLNRLYLQLENGLKTVEFKEDEFPLNFLYQNQSRSMGIAHLIVAKGYGFDKSYALYSYDEKLNFISDIKLKNQFDLASSRPLPLVNPIGDHAFFNSPSINGSQNIISFDYDGADLKINQFKVHSTNANPIQFVLSVEGETALSQTASQLLYQGLENGKTESKTDARRIKHSLLRSEQALFLSSALTPGIGSEVIQSTLDKKDLYRPAHFQMLGTKGCAEVGFIFENSKDKIVFSCSDLGKIIKISL